MHEQIASFANHSFYEGRLRTLPDEVTPKKTSRFANLNFPKVNSEDILEQLMATRRMLFFPSETVNTVKLHEDEAKLAVKLVKTIISLYARNGRIFDPLTTVGIITPYRRQIALIKKYLRESHIEGYEKITVDTVERYQGSQREIIIYTFAVNNSRMIESLRNDYFDGDVRIDRKLNVAITRAEQQLIFIGNEGVLSTDLLFYRLFEFVKSKGGYIAEGARSAIAGAIKVPQEDFPTSVTEGVALPTTVFEQIFEKNIIQPIKQVSLRYPSDIMGFSADVCRNILIEYGRANFEQAVLAPTVDGNLQEVSSQNRVMAYCYFNLRKHYFSSLAIFRSGKELFQKNFANTSQRITFLDLGCGPLTSGMAFQEAFGHDNPDFCFEYFGIDISASMRYQAGLFAQTSLFSRQHKFWFGPSLEELPAQWLGDAFRLPRTVILNASYLFGNLTSDQAERLAHQINLLTAAYPLNQYIFVNQNPAADKRNRAYYAFKKALQVITKAVVSRTETVSYKNQALSLYDKREVVFYEMMSN